MLIILGGQRQRWEWGLATIFGAKVNAVTTLDLMTQPDLLVEEGIQEKDKARPVQVTTVTNRKTTFRVTRESVQYIDSFG
jgi:hypothetical protein